MHFILSRVKNSVSKHVVRFNRAWHVLPQAHFTPSSPTSYFYIGDQVDKPLRVELLLLRSTENFKTKEHYLCDLFSTKKINKIKLRANLYRGCPLLTLGIMGFLSCHSFFSYKNRTMQEDRRKSATDIRTHWKIMKLLSFSAKT